MLRREKADNRHMQHAVAHCGSHLEHQVPQPHDAAIGLVGDGADPRPDEDVLGFKEAHLLRLKQAHVRTEIHPLADAHEIIIGERKPRRGRIRRTVDLVQCPQALQVALERSIDLLKIAAAHAELVRALQRLLRELSHEHLV